MSSQKKTEPTKADGKKSGEGAQRGDEKLLGDGKARGDAEKSRARRSEPPAIPADAARIAPPTTENSDADDRVVRRRPAGPARSRIAANDDLPSIGGLIFALQQTPSRGPFVAAAIGSAIWAVLGSLLAFTTFGHHYEGVATWSAVFFHPVTLTMAATVFLPMVVFWFLALLSWRSQELRLVSSAMTEVAVRLAEPDRMAEQSVASLGQTVRQQVGAMNDAIARALGRAGELEALVHNEVSALERSYSDNELRIRRLIDDLANERQLLTNNSDKMGDAIRGIGNQVARDIHIARDQATEALSDATNSLAENFASKGEKVTSAMRAAGTAIDESLTQHGSKLTEQIARQGSKAAEVLHQAGEQVNSSLKRSTDETTALLTSKGNTLLTSVTSMNEKIGQQLPMLLERLGGEQGRLSTIIGDAVNNLSALESGLTHQTGRIEATLSSRTSHLENVLQNHLRGVDKSLSERTQMLDAAIGQRTRAIDSSLGERAKAFDGALQQKAQMIDAALTERSKYIDAAFSQHVQDLDGSINRQTEIITQALIGRSQAIQETLGEQAKLLDDTFLKGVEAIRVTTKNLSSQSVGTVEALAAQADVLKSVSEGLLHKVGGLTQKFENQGHAVMSAAEMFETSQVRMDSVLENRRAELTGLLENISSRAVQIDDMMENYSDKLETSLTEAQQRARELSTQIASDSQSKSQRALAELEAMRNEAKHHAETAVSELRDRFSTVSEQITGQIGNLSAMFEDSTKSMKQSAASAAAELQSSQDELKRRVEALPDETRASAKAMRQALSDQLRAIDELNSIARKHTDARDITPSVAQQQTSPKASIPDQRGRPVAQAGAAARMGGERKVDPGSPIAGGAPASQRPQQMPPRYPAAQAPVGGVAPAAGGPAPTSQPNGGSARRGASEGLNPAQVAIIQQQAGAKSGQPGKAASVTGRDEAEQRAERQVPDYDALTASIAQTVEDGRKGQIYRGVSLEGAASRNSEVAKVDDSGWSMGDLLARASDEEENADEEIIDLPSKPIIEQVARPAQKTVQAEPPLTRKQAVPQQPIRPSAPAPDTNSAPSADASQAPRQSAPQPNRISLSMQPNGPAVSSDAGPAANVSPAQPSGPGFAPQQAAASAQNVGAESAVPPQQPPMSVAPSAVQEDLQPGPSMSNPGKVGDRSDGMPPPIQPSLSAALNNIPAPPDPTMSPPATPRAPMAPSAGPVNIAPPAPPAAAPAENQPPLLNINAIAKAVDSGKAQEIWLRYQSGESGLFSHELYTQEGQLTFDEVKRRYSYEPDYRQSVNRYLDDFANMLTDADKKDPSGQMITNHLNSEMGLAYLLMSHASGRLS